MLRNISIAALALCSAAACAQTVWRAADGPKTISGTYTVPAGTTLTIEPGVRVNIKASSRLDIQGTLEGLGTVAAPISFVGADNYSALMTVAGTLHLSHAVVNTQTQAMNHGTLLFEDSRFTGVGLLGADPSSYTFDYPPFVQIDRCTFDGPNSNIYISNVILAMRDSSFINGAWCNVSYSYVLLDRISSRNASLNAFTFALDHSLLLDNLNIQNANGAAVSVGGANWGTNHFAGPHNVLTGNLYTAAGWGFLPGTSFPATGNVNNAVLFASNGDIRAPFTTPDVGIPYLIDGYPHLYGGGAWTILPGAKFKFTPNSGLSIDRGYFRVRGTKQNPVVMECSDPALNWRQIHFNKHNDHMTGMVVRDSAEGINGGLTTIQDSLFENNVIATQGGATTRYSTFRANDKAYIGDQNQTPFNSYINNGLAINSTGTRTVDARNNWWGKSTGPSPADTQGPVATKPFLTAPPSDTSSPIVEVHQFPIGLQPGQKTVISWESSDDVRVVSHKVQFSVAGNFIGNFTTIATLPGDQHSMEWKVPNIGAQSVTDPAFVRVIAIDNEGREQYDEQVVQIPAYDTIQGQLKFTNSLGGKVFLTGQRVDLSWTHSLNSNYIFTTYVFVDDDRSYPTGGGFVNYGAWTGIPLPYVSSNRVRIGLRVEDGQNRLKWFFTPYFSVRPDSRIGDKPAVVKLVSPVSDAVYAPGAVVPISWTARDDEGLHSFDIWASFDNGRTWNVVVLGLPGDSRSYSWQTAPGTGFANVKVRVVAKDHRFQETAVGDALRFTIG